MIVMYIVLIWSSIWSSLGTAARQSINGKTLRMAAEHWEPWVTIREMSDSASYSGVSWKILEYLQDSLHFSTIITRPLDQTWGAPDENGVWGGMVGMVKRNEVDFALGLNV